MNKNQNSKQVVRNFMNLCATMIQANFKGSIQRKYYQKFLPVYRRFKQLLYSGFLGWKTRRVFKLSIVRAKINEIKTLKKQQKSMQVRIAKRDFSDQIKKFLKNGMWTFYLLKQKKVPLTQRSVSISNKNQEKSIIKTNLKQALKIIPRSMDKKSSIKQKQIVNKPIKDKKIRNQNVNQTQQKKIQHEKSNKKQSKFKKFEVPPKQTKKVKKQKEDNLKIKTQIHELQFIEEPFIQCHTPSEFLQNQKLNEFCFKTKPRQSNPVKNRQIQQKQDQPVFMKINMLGYTSRKGLNMTLSKKYVTGIKDETQKIMEIATHDFSKIKIGHQRTDNISDKYSSLSTNDVTPFNEIDQGKQPYQQKTQKVNRIIQKKVLINLDMKKQDFQKKKLQFKKRSQKFKSVLA